MNIGLEMITENVGMSLEHIVLLAIVLGNLMFWAVKFELGNLMLMFASAAVFVFQYNGHQNYTYSLIVLFISIIFMAFSLLQSGKDTRVMA